MYRSSIPSKMSLLAGELQSDIEAAAASTTSASTTSASTSASSINATAAENKIKKKKKEKEKAQQRRLVSMPHRRYLFGCVLGAAHYDPAMDPTVLKFDLPAGADVYLGDGRARMMDDTSAFRELQAGGAGAGAGAGAGTSNDDGNDDNNVINVTAASTAAAAAAARLYQVSLIID